MAFLPVLIYMALRRVGSQLRPSMAFAVTVLVCFLGLFISSLSGAADLVGILALKQKDFVNVATITDAGSVISIPGFDSVFSFITQSPGAVWRTYFRPGLWETRTSFDTIAALENALYILLVLCAVVFRKKKMDADLVAIALIFILGMGVFIGSVTPVLGAIVRYKVPALPFLIIICFEMIDTKYLKKINLL